MKQASYLLAFIALVCVINQGNALKCYSQLCTNTSMGMLTKTTNCSISASREIACAKMYGQPTLPDRCIVTSTVTSTAAMNRTVVEHKCAYSFMCPTICNPANAQPNTKCNAECCEGDLCNKIGSRPTGPPPTQPPKPTGPVGKDLTCYECGSTEGSPLDSKCDKPVKRICGNDDMGKPQSKCMTMTMKVKAPGGEYVQSEMRNCSSPMRCNQAVMCPQMTAMMNATDCKISCCEGNLCNTSENPSSDSIKIGASAIMVFLLSIGLIARF